MKFTINKKAIGDVLSKVQGLTARKSNLGITENILIRSSDASIQLSATDLETGFDGTYPADLDVAGAIAINAKKFFEIVKEFPSDTIEINEIENRWIEIGNQKVQYHIVGMNPDDFPVTPTLEAVPLFNIAADALRSMIEKAVMISGSGDDKRAHINGVYFERRTVGDQLVVRMVSTDGSRLATVDVAYSDPADLPEWDGVLIPKKGLGEVAKFLDGGGVVQIGIKDSYFMAQKGGDTLIIRLLEGDFPKYDDIVSKQNAYTLSIDKKPFAMMLRRMSILSSEKYKGAIFNFDKNQLVITATNPDIGESKEDLAIAYEGEKIEAAFNPKFFSDCLNAIDEDNVLLHMVDGEKPCLVEGEKDKSFLTVIMPMRI
ncbi:MAG: DNA polymerase III subunit beta [Desulfosarcinaceae bacterium]|nr:DNA polymerase III subunit beta [Desulfosarcinaceae bacterium]